jgi:hypothetical protein
MVLRRQLWKAVLVLLVLIGTVSSQAASFGSHHSEEHATHCCGVCHIGHLTLLDAAGAFDFVAPSLLYWHRAVEKATRAPEPQVVLDLSRAPPAQPLSR